MARHEWISDEWAKTEFITIDKGKHVSVWDHIAHELNAIMGHATQEARDTFLRKSLEAIDAHRKLVIVRFTDNRSLRRTKIASLAKAARECHRAMSALDLSTRELLEQAQWLTLNQQDIPYETRNAEAIEWARGTEDAAVRLLRYRKPASTRGGRPLGKMGMLVADIAIAYAQNLGARPSAAPGGTFACALRALLDAAGIRMIGASQLTRGLKGLPIAVPAPKRGRKRLSENATKPTAKR